MPKSALERRLEQNQREAKKMADEEALRLRASSIVNGQEIIDGFRVIDVNAEIILKQLINLCDDVETGHVKFEDGDFPAQFQHGMSLELEKLTQYGMLNVYVKWWGGGIIILLPAAFAYFEEKEKAIQRKKSKSSASVENHYHAGANVITGEVTASAIVAGDGNSVDVSAANSDSQNHVIAGEDHEHNIVSSIFISHRSTDKAIADILLDFFIGCGVPREAVFCSSLPGNDVREKISKEVKAALVASTINIAILSNDYYESAYCLNEAGILWFFDDKLVVPIALPEITNENMIGFLDNDYKLRRLNDESDIAYLLDAVAGRLGIADTKYTVVREESRKLIEKYNLYLEKR